MPIPNTKFYAHVFLSIIGLIVDFPLLFPMQDIIFFVELVCVAAIVVFTNLTLNSHATLLVVTNSSEPESEIHCFKIQHVFLIDMVLKHQQFVEFVFTFSCHNLVFHRFFFPFFGFFAPFAGFPFFPLPSSFSTAGFFTSTYSTRSPWHFFWKENQKEV